MGLSFLALILLAALYREGLLSGAVDVQVSSVQRIFPSQTFTLLNASGYVVAQRKAAVASKITGRLLFLGVEEGSEIRKGEVIARLENEDAAAVRDRASAAVGAARYAGEVARAELEDALRDMNRKRSLVERGYVSQQEYDASEARYEKAKAALAMREAEVKVSEAVLKEAEVMLEYTFIRAPFDAVVLTKNADVGDIVTPIGAAANAKASVVTIADMDSLQVEVDVSESSISKVKLGQPCEIQLDALPDDRFPGTVHMVVPTADRSKASVLVKVSFAEKDKRILPEMSAKVAFLSRTVSQEELRPFVAVPNSALVHSRDGPAVFVVQNGRAEERGVRVGRRFSTTTEILAGLKPGEKVVSPPPEGLKEGAKLHSTQE